MVSDPLPEYWRARQDNGDRDFPLHQIGRLLDNTRCFTCFPNVEGAWLSRDDNQVRFASGIKHTLVCRPLEVDKHQISRALRIPESRKQGLGVAHHGQDFGEACLSEGCVQGSIGICVYTRDPVFSTSA